MFDYKKCYDLIATKNRNTSVELIVGTKCQKACKYCYRVRNQNDYGIVNETDIDRLKMYYDNAKEMGLIRKNKKYEFELFGGDPIIDLDILRYTYDKFKDDASYFILPSNCTVLENLPMSDIEALVSYFNNQLYVSISADTPFMEKDNRPLSSFGKMQGLSEERNWDKLVAISKKFQWGFHPMLYLENVDNWFESFKWIIDQDVMCYLLEVRHGHFDFKVIKKGVSQLLKMRKYCDTRGKDCAQYNIFKFSHVPRGLSCSALSSLLISLDGKSYFCHRLMDKRYEYADFIQKKIDPSKYILFKSGYDFRNSPICNACPINDVCHSVCPGMVDEYWDSMNCMQVPIISMCKYFLLKYAVFAKCFKVEYQNLIKMNVDVEYLFKYVKSLFGDDILDELIEGAK